ncbi:hypothetical protein ACH5RR_038461 [Cinchona calisaya]|uniref:Selenoprotein H n=1 Tax=Cinchona calisaya TaxID=153742 RepID=A0ABD2Y0Y7_9GENT
MAPRKRTVVAPSTRVLRSSGRVTRSSAKKAAIRPILHELPEKKKPKTEPKKQESEMSAAAAEAEAEAEEEEEETTEADAVVLDGSSNNNNKTIIVEHCKQCKSFKERAVMVKEGLEKGLNGEINVVLNPGNPRKGCFEIREDGENGEVFISLLEMKRPFTPMKELDMEKVVSDILEKIKN